MPQLDQFTYFTRVMSEFAPIFLSFGISLLVSVIILSLILLKSVPTKRGLPTYFLFVVTTLIFMSFGIPVAFCAGESLSAVPSHSEWLTYTDDMLEDPASSGRSSSTSAVNQPLPGEQAARPFMRREAAPPYVRYPYHPEEVIGGDSVRSIEGRLLSGNPAPSPIELSIARYNAEDRFEVKVDLIRRMTVLDPTGDWLGRGARALDSPAGEISLERLKSLFNEINRGGVNSSAFRSLQNRVLRRRADLDDHSAT